MTFRRVKRLSRKEDYDSAECTGAEGDIYQSGAETYKPSELYKTLAYCGGTLPRNHKQRSLMKWKTLTDSPEHERRIVTLEKQDGEAFGFEIQTYGLHHRDENTMEMCTFVCRVRENTPAELGGLRQGDTITSINGTLVSGFRHRDIVDLIKSSGNFLRLETVYGTSIRRAELETRLQYLKQTLQEKWEEYRSLMVQEQRLVHGIVSKDPSVYDAFESVRASLCGPAHYLCPSAQRQPGSGGSTRCSAMEGEDEPIYQTCIFDPLDTGSDGSHGSEVVLAKKLLTRSVSAKAGHNGVTCSSWDKGNNQSAFGTLPRKSRRKSLRKRLLKYIPGLNRSVEEEESQL
ncbi:general receptor for phosphoinositides 1-associated scaffold protein [Hemiscyllium ocellatum]|uniref:general receptor for phosphoinositides 1-associated scaffold protein n=1 Tax=Hemiscyllium ocellatum TaxID=170820 RepID=UPI002966F647|nr:general receptor for phosphoinositides 1-associated scaffold protein [Hemiscyllium ocellatum]